MQSEWLKLVGYSQAMAFKPVMEGRSCIVADQTGSGKTLAYVAPLVQMLRLEEAKSDVKSLSKKPRVLVLVPTSELAVQVSMPSFGLPDLIFFLLALKS